MLEFRLAHEPCRFDYIQILTPATTAPKGFLFLLKFQHLMFSYRHVLKIYRLEDQVGILVHYDRKRDFFGTRLEAVTACSQKTGLAQ